MGSEYSFPASTCLYCFSNRFSMSTPRKKEIGWIIREIQHNGNRNATESKMFFFKPWEESIQKCFCVPQNLITCTGQAWRQVFIAVVTVVAATQQSHLGNPECYSNFSCLLTEPMLGIATVSHKEENNFQTLPLSCPAVLFSLWCRRNPLCLPFQQSLEFLFTSSDLHQSSTIHTLLYHNSSCS